MIEAYRECLKFLNNNYGFIAFFISIASLALAILALYLV